MDDIFLRHVAHQRGVGLAALGQVDAVVGHAARSRGQLPGQQAHQRRLARPARPRHRGHAGRSEPQRDVVEQRAAAPAPRARRVHPRGPDPDTHPCDLLQWLERGRADARAVRADLEDVADAGLLPAAQAMAVEVSPRGCAPVFQPQRSRGVPAHREVPRLDQGMVQSHAAFGGAADQVGLVRPRQDGAQRAFPQRPPVVGRHPDGDEIADPVGQAQHVAVRDARALDGDPVQENLAARRQRLDHPGAVARDDASMAWGQERGRNDQISLGGGPDRGAACRRVSDRRSRPQISSICTAGIGSAAVGPGASVNRGAAACGGCRVTGAARSNGGRTSWGRCGSGRPEVSGEPVSRAGMVSRYPEARGDQAGCGAWAVCGARAAAT